MTVPTLAVIDVSLGLMTTSDPTGGKIKLTGIFICKAPFSNKLCSVVKFM